MRPNPVLVRSVSQVQIKVKPNKKKSKRGKSRALEIFTSRFLINEYLRLKNINIPKEILLGAFPNNNVDNANAINITKNSWELIKVLIFVKAFIQKI